MRLLPALLALLAFAVPFAARADSSESIDVGGVTRTYVLHVPPHLASPAALILSFHGHFGTGAGQARLSGMDPLSDRYGFVVAYPDGLNRGWNDGRPGGRNTADDLGFARALVSKLSKQFGLDRKRVYATGMSNGATFTQYLACREGDVFAAIAPVAGSMPSNDYHSCGAAYNMSVLEIAGTADPIMPFGGGNITLLGAGTSGSVESFDVTLSYWAASNYCTTEPVKTALPPIAPADGTSILRWVYRSCAPGYSVIGYEVVGGGHTWPGGPQYLPRGIIGPASGQMNASEVIVKFFLAHSLH